MSLHLRVPGEICDTCHHPWRETTEEVTAACMCLCHDDVGILYDLMTEAIDKRLGGARIR